MSDAVFTPALLDEVGAALAVLRNDTCLIRRRATGSVDAGGGRDPSFSNGATVGCRVTPKAAARITVVSGRVTPEADYVIAVPRGTEVDQHDQVAVKGQTLTVLNDPHLPSVSFELLLNCKSAD